MIIKKTFLKISVLGILSLFFFLPSVASAGTLRKPPNNLGLVAYWPFNEDVGTVASDASGNGHIGTLTGTVSLPVWSSGKLGGAVSFGAGNNIRVTFDPITTGTTNTISAWIYLSEDCVNYGSILAQDAIEGLYCYQNGGGSNKLDFWYSGTPTDHFSNTALALNRWYHIAIVNTAGSATFYLNGVADGTVAAVPSFNANTMGGDTSNETFYGKIDEVRLYSRALSAAQINALYKSGSIRVSNSYKSPGTLRTNLTGYWTFDGKDMIQNVTNVQGATARNGKLVNFTSTTTAPGKVGQALTFDGFDDYIDTTTVTSFMSSATGTVSVWLRPTGGTRDITSTLTMYNALPAVSTSGIFGSFGISRANRTDLGQDRIWVWRYSDAAIGVPYNAGEWIHITMVHANGLLSIYKNGDFVESVAAGNFSSFTGNLYIGGMWSGSASRWRGDIDEVRTYSRGLSASEIKQLYNLTLGTKVNKPSVNSLTTGLVGYWTFDGGDTDWSANTVVNRGSLGGTATFVSMSTTSSPVPGKVGQGLTFNGTSSYVNLGSSSSLKIGTGNYSASLWYKGLKGSTESFLSFGPTCCTPYFDITSSLTNLSNGVDSVSKSYTLPQDNGWHHLAVVLDRTPSPDTLEVYVDGVSQGSATGTLDGGSITTAGATAIGLNSWASGSSKRQGPTDEVRIYNRTLSAAEVLQLYRMGK